MTTQASSQSILTALAGAQLAYQNTTAKLGEHLDAMLSGDAQDKTAAQRLWEGIGTAQKVEDPKVTRANDNQTAYQYPGFDGLYGLNTELQQVAQFFRGASQNGAQSRQILLLVGPNGSGKTHLVDLLKTMLEKQPAYRLKESPYNDNPLSLLNNPDLKEVLQDTPLALKHAQQYALSEWGEKKLTALKQDAAGDENALVQQLAELEVEGFYPSQETQDGIVQIEAGDPEDAHDQLLDGLKAANGGVLVLSEALKMAAANPHFLNGLLDTLSSGQYTKPDGGVAPWNGAMIITANLEEYEKFAQNDANKALFSRIVKVEIPYITRYSAEVEMYRQELAKGSLEDAPCAPHTLDLLAQFAVATRLETHPEGRMRDKVRAYDGDDIGAGKPSLDDYKKPLRKQDSGVFEHAEGMKKGLRTRDAHKLLTVVFNHSAIDDPSADPMALFAVLKNWIKTPEAKDTIADIDAAEQFISDLKDDYWENRLGNDIKQACLNEYKQAGEETRKKYLTYVEHVISEQGASYRDPETGEEMDAAELEEFLSDVEGGVVELDAGDPEAVKDFRQNVNNAALKIKGGDTLTGNYEAAYSRLAAAATKKAEPDYQDLSTVLNSLQSVSAEDKGKRDEFFAAMEAMGYTKNQVKKLAGHYKSEVFDRQPSPSPELV